MKQNQRSKTARVAAVLAMAATRPYHPVTRKVARSAVQARMKMVHYIAMGRSYAWAWGLCNGKEYFSEAMNHINQ